MTTFCENLKSDTNEETEESEDEDDLVDDYSCVVCRKHSDILEYCCNAGCDMYMCNSCYIQLSSGDIICSECVGNCSRCNEIINLSDIEKNTDVSCRQCKNEKTYCEKCTELYHLFSCNINVCHICVNKCISCDKVSCCNKTFVINSISKNIYMCDICIVDKLKESRDYLVRDLLRKYTTFCDDEISVIMMYCL